MFNLLAKTNRGKWLAVFIIFLEAKLPVCFIIFFEAVITGHSTAA
jgi:hypothetical protein